MASLAEVIFTSVSGCKCFFLLSERVRLSSVSQRVLLFAARLVVFNIYFFLFVFL